ncbi:heme exporter protein CcmB [Saccharobesus litoralis]|uniref:Heme exporter protein B n=1 Tax=Saccharobesus litoralis TaxID=2172099 RepID=A0A2S0VT65_9ALTE|nr:heme exporter protein CcmB [Saccharobesus litoralis]AWB67397.1 heme exporter protein CcmB [Saccharobesus litoralis]
MSYFQYFSHSLKRDFQVAATQKHEFGLPLIFFVLVVVLVPLSIGPEANLLSRIAPAIGWIAVILSILIALPRMFSEEFDNGWLEQVFISGHPSILSVLSRVLSFWLLYGLPLVLASILLVPFLQLALSTWWVLAQTLVLGSLLMTALGSIASAMLLGSRKGSGILALLVIPLLIPALIFASAAVDAAAQGIPAQGPMLMLTGLAVLGITLAPIATEHSLKLVMS